MAVKRYTTLCKFGPFIYCHVFGSRRTLRRPYDTSAWDGKGGHTTNDTCAVNVTAHRNRDFHEEVLILKAAADGVELLALPEKSKAQASLSTLFDKQTSKQTSTSPRPVPSVGGSVAMKTGSYLGRTVSSGPVSSVGGSVASMRQLSIGAITSLRAGFSTASDSLRAGLSTGTKCCEGMVPSKLIFKDLMFLMCKYGIVSSDK